MLGVIYLEFDCVIFPIKKVSVPNDAGLSAAVSLKLTVIKFNNNKKKSINYKNLKYAH